MAIEIKHGTVSGYRAGCRDECCRAPKRAERARLLAVKSGDPVDAAEQTKPLASHTAATVAATVRKELEQYRNGAPTLCAMAEALANEIDAGHKVNGVAGAAKQLTATLEAIKAQVKGGSQSDAIVSKWGRPALASVPASVRHKA